jgi:hypothetical protein
MRPIRSKIHRLVGNAMTALRSALFADVLLLDLGAFIHTKRISFVKNSVVSVNLRNLLTAYKDTAMVGRWKAMLAYWDDV